MSILSIRPYQKRSHHELMDLMNMLQRHITDIDPMRKLKYFEDSGEAYTADLLEKITKNRGKIFLAFDDKKQVIGMIAGILVKQTKIELIQDQPKKIGTIIELVVNPEIREKGVGSMLMKTMEEYFIAHGCNWLTVEVFAPNINAYKFYQKHNYQNRSIYMVKSL